MNFIKKSMNYNFIWAIEVRGKLRPGVVCVVLLYMSHKFFSPVGNKFCPILKDMINASSQEVLRVREETHVTLVLKQNRVFS